MAVVQIPVGDTRCVYGGAAISAQGVTVNVCSGVAPPPPAPESTLIGSPEFQKINSWANLPASQQWVVCYRMTRDGASPGAFHANCDNKGKTFYVARSSSGKVWGGYTTLSWAHFSCSGNYKVDSDAFLFSITNNYRHAQDLTKAASIYACSSHGPTFGGGWDMYMPLAGTGSSNLGYSYQCRVGAYGSATCQADLAGASNFTVTEVEVFYAQ